MGFIEAKSIPTMVDCIGMYFCATCSHPPGAAHKSKQAFALDKKSYFLFS
jgi:hypothetical protein